MVIDGNRNAMQRLTKMLIFLSSVLVTSKRSSSACSELNARTTRRPESRSAMTWLSRSSLLCRMRNLGITAKNMNTMMQMITASASPIVHVREGLVASARTSAPMPMIGAKIAMRSVMTAACWICWTSLVARVMSDAVLKLSSSADEKSVTFENSARRISRDAPAAVRDAKNPPPTANSEHANASPTMMRPVL